MVWNRRVTKEEWTLFSARCDEAWDHFHKTWNPEALAAIMTEVTERKVYLVRFEP
jgi:hypothetical protein